MNDKIRTTLEGFGYTVNWRSETEFLMQRGLSYLMTPVEALRHFLQDKSQTGARIEHMWRTTFSVPDVEFSEVAHGRIRMSSDIACFIDYGASIDEVTGRQWCRIHGFDYDEVI